MGTIFLKGRGFRTVLGMILGLGFVSSLFAAGWGSSREIDFNGGWRFNRGDVEGGQDPSLSDAQWRVLNLPHDYSVEDVPNRGDVGGVGPFSRESVGGAATGHTVGGVAWYRKRLTLDSDDVGKRLRIVFGGVYMNAEVWINGVRLGQQPYGYTSFSYDLTPYLKALGEENVVAVRVDNSGQNSRWYSGSGIYRDVKLLKTSDIYVDLWGSFIETPCVSDQMATVAVETQVKNLSGKNQTIVVENRVMDADGKVLVRAKKGIRAGASGGFAYIEMTVPNPRRWSVDSPSLYTLETNVYARGELLDTTRERFGIRTLSFSAGQGFLLNGSPLLLKGVCMHHGNGILGAAAFDRAEYRRVALMKQAGYNAIRCSHNPPSVTFLNACDELGMLVIDESFDQWKKAKKEHDYHLYFDDWWERDLEAMLKRDRNHPSIIMWSFGNEIEERGDPEGLDIAGMLVAKIREMDTSRPVTQAVCKFWEFPDRDPWADSAGAFELVDVAGYNYQWRRYEEDHVAFPERVMYGSETIGKEMYDSWKATEALPYVIGDFVWTGMDYLGESGIGYTLLKDTQDEEWMGLPPWPWFNANCGDIDLIGHRKPQGLYRDVLWGNSRIEILVHEPIPEGKFEHISYWGWPDERRTWNWDVSEGEPLSVAVYSDAEVVHLELNGEIIGVREMKESDKLTARFDVPYRAGTLVAVAMDGGREVGRTVIETTGTSDRIRLLPERSQISADTSEIVFVQLEILDSEGRLVPDSDLIVDFEVSGPAYLQSAGNANPIGMERFQDSQVTSFQGRALIVLRSNGSSGEISLVARSKHLKEARCQILVR